MWIQEGLGTVQGAVSGELEALHEGLNKRQAAAATRTQLQLLRDTAHAQSKVTSSAQDDQHCFHSAMPNPALRFSKLSCSWLWAAFGVPFASLTLSQSNDLRLAGRGKEGPSRLRLYMARP